MPKITSFLSKYAGKVSRKYNLLTQGRAQCLPLALSLTQRKRGLEIGGPTDVFRGWKNPSRLYWFAPLPIYDKVGSLDNCNFSSSTIWGEHEESYKFSPDRPAGKIVIAEGTDMSQVPDGTYDFVVSSHNLEHFANPVRALKEWERVTRPGGALVLVLPHYTQTFDHKRQPTSVDHMLEDYERAVGEDDMTHFEEVISLHDTTRDGFLKTGTKEEFRARCEANLQNRMMHHHVFDEHNTVELLNRVGMEVLAVERSLPYHLIVLATWKS